MKSVTEPRKRSKASQAPLIRYYLVAYNVLSAVGWSYVFFTTSAHLSGLTTLSRVASVSPGAISAFKRMSPSATSALKNILGSIPYLKSSVPISTGVQSRLPASLIPLLNRATTTFVAVSVQTALVQTFATLEIAHSLLGWVRSPITTAAMQVASRLILVWGITEQYESARNNPIYASMVLAWSITEIIRYSFYAADRLNYETPWLLWLRYNSFFVLYPLGAGSEAALIFSTLPSSAPPQPGSSWTNKTWNGSAYGRAVLFFLWWPGLYVMYSYMIQQRRKVFGAKASGTQAKKYKSN